MNYCIFDPHKNLLFFNTKIKIIIFIFYTFLMSKVDKYFLLSKLTFNMIHLKSNMKKSML